MWPFNKKTKTQEVRPSGRRAGMPLWVKGFRRGMWVVKDGATGILTEINSDGVAEVMLVDDQGLNLRQVHVNMHNLRQATRDEIPEPRRPDEETATALGY